MIVYYIQPSMPWWYVMRDDSPTARHTSAKHAVALATLLAKRDRAQMLDAEFLGIDTETLVLPAAAAPFREAKVA